MVVVVDAPFSDRRFRLFDNIDHILLGNRIAGHAPVLTAFGERAAHLARRGVQIADLPFGDDLLQFFVGAEGKIHPPEIALCIEKIGCSVNQPQMRSLSLFFYGKRLQKVGIKLVTDTVVQLCRGKERIPRCVWQ